MLLREIHRLQEVTLRANAFVRMARYHRLERPHGQHVANLVQRLGNATAEIVGFVLSRNRCRHRRLAPFLHLARASFLMPGQNLGSDS